MTVIYEVNLNVDSDIAPEFARWLVGHVNDMLALPGFLSAETAREERESAETVGWSVRYHLESRQALETYFQHHAAQMRADGIKRFGQAFSASRRILVPADSG